MLIFNPRRVLAMRGIDRMFSYLYDNGFVRSTASYLISGKASHVKIEHIGKICVLLNCTPNDLFEWKTDAQNAISEDHALNTIVRDGTTVKSLKEMIKGIPIEKLPEIENLLKGLKDS